MTDQPDSSARVETAETIVAAFWKWAEPYKGASEGYGPTLVQAFCAGWLARERALTPPPSPGSTGEDGGEG